MLKNKTKGVIVAAFFSVFGTQQAGAVLMDFDSFASGTLVNAPISGVAFTLDNGESASISNAASVSSPNGLLNAEAFSFSEPSGNLTLSFLNACLAAP